MKGFRALFHLYYPLNSKMPSRESEECLTMFRYFYRETMKKDLLRAREIALMRKGSRLGVENHTLVVIPRPRKRKSLR